MDKPIFLRFAVLELSKLTMYEIQYDRLHPFFGQENIKLQNMDTDSLVLKVKTGQIIKDLKNLEVIIDFNNLDENHELFSSKNKKVFGKYKIETPENIWTDEFVCPRSKMYAFKNGDDSKTKMEGVSKFHSKNINFEEYYKCLVGGKYLQQLKYSIAKS